MNKSPSTSPNTWSVDQFSIAPKQGKTRFHDFPLAGGLMQAIQTLGYEYCSPIQAESLPFSLAGHDVLGRAQTGTGKTAAFLICVINDLLSNPIESERYAGEARALIIAPTRELVMQIADDARNLTQFTDLKVHSLVGGMDYGKQKTRLHNELVDILVATPGRLMDFCESDDVHLDQIEFMVIDEADRMLDMGFIPQVRRIVRMSPPKENRQTLMFSATFSYEVLNLAEQWMCSHERVEIEPESVATDTVTQHIYLAAGDEKLTMLYNLLQSEGVDNLIVFANRRDECRKLYVELRSLGVKVGLLSGEVDQNKRVKTLDGFKAGTLRVLVATDVAGRGIHIDNISHVVNYSLPDEPEDYVHRIGRTGRAGSSGISISFACEDDAFRLQPIEKLLNHPIVCEQPPEFLVQPLSVEMTLALEEAVKAERRRPRPGASRKSDGRRPGGRANHSQRPR